ncbi:Maf family protein [Peptococcus simiae]|uniref:Maf family protein n=1 Tax=Peptococcus simiae TaxID=1643805 RepID=UPI003980A6DD
MSALVLVSTSAQRQALLAQLGLPFTVAAPKLEVETLKPGWGLDEALADLAFRKAQTVRADYPDALLIGCDTMVVADGEPLGKPADLAAARQMLEALSGRVHQVKSGLALLVPDGRSFQATVTTQVQMKNLTEGLIEAYLATHESRNRAGSYAIQGRGVALTEGIQGSYTNVVGMPLEVLCQWLADIGEEPFGYE